MRLRAGCGESVRALDDPGDLDAGVGAELREDVPDVRLDGLGADEQPLRDLAIRSPVHDEVRDLELTPREQLDAAPLRCPGLRAPMDVPAERPELALRRVAVALGAPPMQLGRRLFELGDGPFAFAARRERSTRERP